MFLKSVEMVYEVGQRVPGTSWIVQGWTRGHKAGRHFNWLVSCMCGRPESQLISVRNHDLRNGRSTGCKKCSAQGRNRKSLQIEYNGFIDARLAPSQEYMDVATTTEQT